MKFMNMPFLPLIIIAIVSFIFYTIRYETSFFLWVKKYFFLDRSPMNKLSSFFFVLGVSLLVVSLLDLRGPEEKHLSDIPDQKTIIIIDSSASMLAEDVRPNRFQKAIILARHFIKKAYGHQIAVVLFSDTQKRLVPFTDDIDLLDARVAGLAKIEIQNGGSNIRQAVAESLQYFKAQDSNITDISGNILVFTDSESNSEAFDVKVPDAVNIAMIGVGTARGAPIPIRNKNGVFKGYKSYNGQKVISKLDENFLKSFGDSVKNYQYWVSTSFTIPTEKILDFFRSQHKAKTSKGLVRSRPVLAKYLLIPALLFYLLSNLISLRPAFITTLLILILVLPVRESYADDSENSEKEEIQLDRKTIRLMNEMKKGQLRSNNKFKIAEGLFKAKKYEEAKVMYEETFNGATAVESKIRLNYGTLLLAMGDIVGGALNYESLHSDVNVLPELKEVARMNLLIALKKKEEEEKQKKKDEKENKDNKDKKKQSGDSSKDNKSEGKEKDQDKDQSKEGKEGKKDNKDKNDEKNKSDEEKKKQKEKEGKKENDKKKQKEKEGKKENDKKKEEKKQTLEEKEEEIRKKRKMVKIPAMLKQIMSDDSQLQRTYLDTSTKKSSSRNQKKDW